MAEQKHSPLLWVGLAGAGVLLWWYLKNKGQTVTVGPTSTLPAGQPTGANAPNPTQLLPVPNTIPVSEPVVQAPPAQQLTLSTPAGIDPTVYQTVNEWAQSTGKPPILAFAAANVPAEYAGMYNLITNFWDKGISPGSNPAYQPEVDFWNNLRDKYDPTHQYW